MKIENNNINNTSFNKTEGAHQVEKQQSTNVENSASVVKKDKAELSDQARLLSKARKALESSSDVNQAKVDEIKAKVDKGEYNIPYDKLADNLMSKLGLN
jgi:negative regulator of flagellin synthesis FlgM